MSTRFLLLFLMINSLVSAELIPVSGIVTDALTNSPVEGVQLTAPGTSTTTDVHGRFTLQANPGDSISAQHIAYEIATFLPSVGEHQVQLVPRVLEGSLVKVYGGFSATPLLEETNGVTVISGERLRESGSSAFQDVIATIPNMNWAGGTSRPRFFQIRGIGERSQYAGDGPPNYSVGFSLDDIDLSGMGMAGILFDIASVETYRGPQSSVFGPNAIAGFINLRSTHPADGAPAYLNIGIGNGATRQIGMAGNLVSRDAFSSRLAVYSNTADGFTRNEFLNREDTNARDERLIRWRTHWQPVGRAQFLQTVYWARLDNGYDNWSPDNNEALISYADQPGKDSQSILAYSLRANLQLTPIWRLTSITALSKAEMEHSYDSDWGNDDFWAQPPYNFDPDVEGWRYSFEDVILRERETVTQELRMKGLALGGRLATTLGLYYKDLTETDDANGYLFGGAVSSLNSTFNLQNLAGYAELKYRIDTRWEVIGNIRQGNRDTRYSDDQGTEFEIKDQLTGGKLTVLSHLSPGTRLFASVARGYKAGGINQHPRISAIHRPFAPEYILNYEAGYRLANEKTQLSIVAFTATREDQQVSVSSQQQEGDPNSYIYYIGNAAVGTQSGLEFEGRWKPLPVLDLAGGLGLIKAHTDAYGFQIAEDQSIELGDRSPAQAPAYTFNASLAYSLFANTVVQVSVEGRDAFYYSDSHNQRSAPYQLVNSSLNWDGGAVEITGYCRNILDTRYAVRGFYFGLEPPDYPDRLYVSYGPPREFGVSLRTIFSR